MEVGKSSSSGGGWWIIEGASKRNILLQNAQHGIGDDDGNVTHRIMEMMMMLMSGYTYSTTLYTSRARPTILHSTHFSTTQPTA